MVEDTISLWISDIQKDEDTLLIKINLQTHVELKGLQFQLQHFPLTIAETVKKSYQQSLSDYEGDDLIEDITLYPYKEFSDTLLVINYANDLSAHLYFDSLNYFLQNKEINLSHEFTHLVMNIDSDASEIHDEGMFLYLGYNDISGDYVTEDTYFILSSSIDSMILPIGETLRAFQDGNNETDINIVLKTDKDSYNYSKFVILNDSTTIELTNPHINLMYWE